MRWGARIDAANQLAVRRMIQVEPRWIDVLPLRQVVSGLTERETLHAGPPVEWVGMGGASRGAVTAAVLAEGWADSAAGAAKLAESRGVHLGSCHDRGGAAWGAVAVTPNTPVFVLDDPSTGAQAWAPVCDPRTAYGVFDENALGACRFLRTEVTPLLGRALSAMGGLPLLPLLSLALERGDDLGLVSVALRDRLLLELLPPLLSAGGARGDLAAMLDYVRVDDTFFAPLVLAAAKLMTDAAVEVEDATVVTAIASNGTELGIRVSGLGERWLRAPAPAPTSAADSADAGAVVGDDALVEVVGLGGFVAPGCPSVWARAGVDRDRALEMAADAAEVAVGVHSSLRVAVLDEPVRLGIDVRKVVEKNTELAVGARVPHKAAGRPALADGFATVPWSCFALALEAFAADRGIR